MSKENLTKQISLTKWQALFRAYEKSISSFQDGSFRTYRVLGITEKGLPQIRSDIAKEIGILLNGFNEHMELKKSRFEEWKKFNESETKITKDKNEDVEMEELDYSDFIFNIGKEFEETFVDENLEINLNFDFKQRINPDQIDLVEINDSSILNLEVFPLSFWCERCKHYELVDSERNQELKCPCCSNLMEQFSYVFVCPRCANIEEFTHRDQKLKDSYGGSLPCPQCSDGHLHFFLKDSFQNAYWKCSNKDCNFSDRLNKYCNCSIRGKPGKEDKEESDKRISDMKPSPVSASSIMVPLVKSYVYAGTEKIKIANLLEQHIQNKEIDNYSWRLLDIFDDNTVNMLRTLYAITDAFTIPKITTKTVIYGYKTGVNSYLTNISYDEKLAQLFSLGKNNFRAYFTSIEGRGFLIKLDEEKILNFLKLKFELNNKIDYNKLASDALYCLNNENLQELLETQDSSIALVKILHAFEHMLITAATEQIGLHDIIGSKIMIEECAVLLYEIDEIGSGGLVQLTQGKNTSEFLKFMKLFKTKSLYCSQLCSDACPACTFINDFHCHPYLSKEVKRWFPPNSILDRSLVEEYFKYLE